MKYTIRVGRFGDKKVSEYDQEALIALVDQSTQLLTECLRQNKVSQGDIVIGTQTNPSSMTLTGPFWMPSAYRIDLTLKRQGVALIRQEVSTAGYLLQGGNHQLEWSIEECQRFKKAIVAGKTPKKGAVLVTRVSKDVFRVEAVSLTKYCCPHCGIILHPTSLKRHIQSPSCRIRATSEELGPEWTRLSNVLAIDAVVASGIKHETRATTYATWVPKWVNQAIDKYKAGDGYAGLRLTEYLKKMKDEQ